MQEIRKGMAVIILNKKFPVFGKVVRPLKDAFQVETDATNGTSFEFYEHELFPLPHLSVGNGKNPGALELFRAMAITMKGMQTEIKELKNT